jgi:hypothetical protein
LGVTCKSLCGHVHLMLSSFQSLLVVGNQLRLEQKFVLDLVSGTVLGWQMSKTVAAKFEQIVELNRRFDIQHHLND